MSGENNPNDEHDDQSRRDQPQDQPPEGQPPEGQPPGDQPQDQPPQGQPQGQPPQGQPPQGQPQGQPPRGQPQGQPPQGQPQGQPPQGQPQGQPPQGQPQGQPPQGQPQGGQPAQGGQYGQPQYQQGPGLLDKLQRPAVKAEIVNTVLVHALLGAGVLLTLLILPNLFGSGSMAAGASSVSFGFAAVGFGGGLLLAVFLGRDIAVLQEESNTVLAASFAGNGIGYLVGGILATIGVVAGPGSLFGGGFGGGGPGLVDYLVPVFIAMLFVGAIGALTTFVERNY